MGVSLVFISDFSRLCCSDLLSLRKASEFSVSSFLPNGTLGEERSKCWQCVHLSRDEAVSQVAAVIILLDLMIYGLV